MPSSTYSTPARFYSLDVMRGVAALAVVLYHWKDFFFVGTHTISFDPRQLPVWDLFSVFYSRGWLAVDLFFSLSGFVFFWLYSNSIVERRISGWNFAVLRFSRLYPLHFATLLLAAAGQFLYFGMVGDYFVVPFNDTSHLLLNLFFASSWGLERGLSFNGPAWSVSVEVLLYAAFFFYCRRLPLRLSVLLLISVLGFLFLRGLLDPVGRGVASFFLGGGVYLVYRRILASGQLDRYLRSLLFLTVLLWSMSILWHKTGSPGAWLLGDSVPFLWHFGTTWSSLGDLWTRAVLFPLTILVLALTETKRGQLGGRISFLGDISYSIYLIHFPLQLWVVVVVLHFGLDTRLFASPWFPFAFFALLLSLSLASHRFFEVPVQNLLRRFGVATRRGQVEMAGPK